MAERPKILLIKPVLPYPPDQGTKVATLGLIKALRDEFDVTVLARIISEDELPLARELEKWCSRVVTVMAPNRKSVLHRATYKLFYSLKSALTGRSLKSLYDCPGALVHAARQLAAENYDLVIIEYWQLYPLIPVFSDTTLVLFTHDIDMLVNREISLLERNLVRKIQAVRRWLRERKEELVAYQAARNVWTLTERDQSAVQSICRDNCSIEVLPFGIDIESHSPPGMRRNTGEVLFMGYLEAPFNRDALEYFVQRVYPHLQDVDGVSITVVGGGLPKELEYFALQPEVEVVGRVADVRPYLHRAACLAVPLRFGGGLRIRILEAMAAELPVVCTPMAIAGMPFEPDRDYLLGETAEAFAGQIERIVTENGLARAISQAARQRVEELYAMERQRRRTAELVRALINSS